MAGTRSFAICSNQHNHITITKAHLNLWLFWQKKYVIDVGMQMKIASEALAGKIEFVLYTPFLTTEDQEFEDLYTKLSNRLTLQVIFNDSVLQYTVVDKNNNTDDASLIKFANKTPLLLIKPRITRLSADSIKIEIDPSILDLEQLPDAYECYLRFRYRTKSVSNVFITESGGLNDKVHFDFRFNEPRQLPKEEIRSIQASMLKVERLFLFMMNGLDFKISLNEKPLEYIRFLEIDGFNEYMPELKDLKKQLLVYFWKIDLKDNPTANMVIAFEREKEAVTQFRSGVFVNVFSSAAIFGSEFIKGVAEDFPSFSVLVTIFTITKYISYFIFVISFIYTIVAITKYLPVIWAEGLKKFAKRGR